MKNFHLLRNIRSEEQAQTLFYLTNSLFFAYYKWNYTDKIRACPNKKKENAQNPNIYHTHKNTSTKKKFGETKWQKEHLFMTSTKIMKGSK